MAWQRAADKREGEPPNAADVHDAAVRLLARREHSCVELHRKLSRKFGTRLELGVLNKVLDELIEQGLQSDQRYAEARVRQRIDAGYGPLKIKHDLLASGICGDLARDSVDALSPNWFEQARNALESRFGTTSSESERDKGRWVRFLNTRGFPQSIVRSIVLDG